MSKELEFDVIIDWALCPNCENNRQHAIKNANGPISFECEACDKDFSKIDIRCSQCDEIFTCRTATIENNNIVVYCPNCEQLHILYEGIE
jgi:hypothetical protein